MARPRTNIKYVKKNITIPEWLNDFVTKEGGINMSSYLTMGIKRALGDYDVIPYPSVNSYKKISPNLGDQKLVNYVKKNMTIPEELADRVNNFEGKINLSFCFCEEVKCRFGIC